MAIGPDSEFFNFTVSSSQSPSVRSEVPFYCAKSFKSRTAFHSGKILKPRRSSSLNWCSKSLFAHLQQPEFLHKNGVLKKSRPSTLLGPRNMRDSEMNDVMDNVLFERKLYDYTNHGFDQAMLTNENVLPSEMESPKNPGSRFNSPVDDGSGRSSKSQSSIEDLNKEIERLFLNNEKFGFTSFVWDKDELAEGRRAPVADMLHCYKGYNRRKKRRSATALGIRNYNESDSSNGVSSPDDNSGCEEYSKTKLNDNVDPPIVVPVPGKSGIEHSQTVSISGPFSGNKLQLSEDSAFAPIKSIPRSQSTPPQSTIDIVENDENKVF